jgi:BON domain
MGEYEDRYPDAYGRDEAPPPSSTPQPRDRKEAPPRPASEQLPPRSLRWGGTRSGMAPPPPWQHAPAETAPATAPASSRSPGRDYRGVGPRGYVRSPTRIYEDICDRLAEHPLIDASDIEVLISGIEVVLAGSVDNAITADRAEALARQVPGVTAVRNALTVRAGGDR